MRTARLEGAGIPNIFLRHALLRALIAPFMVNTLQFPWLPSGVTIVETLATVGESECGKSTVTKVLMGFETATDGKILLDDDEIGGSSIER